MTAETAWYDQPMDDDWSDVSNLEGYDGANWTNDLSVSNGGESIFDNVPVMDNWDTWNNPESGLSYNWSSGGSMPGYNEFGNWTGQNLDMDVQQNMPSLPQGWGDMGSVGATLKDLFSSPGGGALVKGIGALLEGSQNKRMAKDMRGIVQQQQARQSPFDVAGGAPAGSMRAQMQQALTGAMNNPMAVPHIKAQVDQIAKAQAIKDAAAGRRSNSATSSPAMLASQGKVVQDYINSLYNPAGAFMQPSMSGLEQLINASKYNTQGYASPIMSAVGYEQRNSQSQAMLDALKEILSGGK